MKQQIKDRKHDLEMDKMQLHFANIIFASFTF